MKAVLCKSLDGPDALEVAEIEPPRAGEGEVVIAVSAAALNFFDTLMTRGKYQFKPEMPFSPGGEIAGTVTEIGPGVSGFAPGQRVMAYVKWNGCREAVAVNAVSVTPIPDGVSDEAAAGLTITYGTAMHGLIDRGRLRPGETVVVLGATGGAGLAAVEIAHLLGARVIAAGTSDDKLAICREHGAADLLNLNTCGDLKDAIRALTGGAGADMIYDCIGGPYAEPALCATAWQGRYLVVGFAAGDIPRIPLNLLLLKGCELVGVFFGRFVELHPDLHRAHMAQVLTWCAEGKLKPHIDRVVELEHTADALHALERREIKGKVIVRV
jgi:NADPH2:quinone reductase